MARVAKARRQKHVPVRTCIACRQVAGKRGLVRLVRTDDGVVVDATGKMPGRGAYLHPSRQCWKSALDGTRIQQALRTKLSAENRELLLEFVAALPDDEGAPRDTSSSVAGSVS